MVIRCFKKEHEFSEVSVNRVNGNIRMVFHNNAATEWLGFRLEVIGTVILCSLALLLVVLPARLSPPRKLSQSASGSIHYLSLIRHRCMHDGFAETEL